MCTSKREVKKNCEGSGPLRKDQHTPALPLTKGSLIDCKTLWVSEDESGFS